MLVQSVWVTYTRELLAICRIIVLKQNRSILLHYLPCRNIKINFSWIWHFTKWFDSTFRHICSLKSLVKTSEEKSKNEIVVKCRERTQHVTTHAYNKKLVLRCNYIDFFFYHHYYDKSWWIWICMKLSHLTFKFIFCHATC